MTTMRRARLLITALVAVLALAGCDWAQFGFDPGHSSFDPAEPALTPTSVVHLHTAWSQPCFCRTPVVSGNHVFAIAVTPGTPGTPFFNAGVRSFAVSGGTEAWGTGIGLASNAAVVAVGNGLVYVALTPADGPDRLLGLDESTGGIRWSVSPPASGTQRLQILAGPLDGPRLFVASWAGEASRLAAIDASGNVVWGAQPGGRIASLAADAGKTIYTSSTIFLTSGGQNLPLLVGYDEQTGALHSAVVMKTSGLAPVDPILVQGGRVFGLDPTDHLGGTGVVRIDPSTGNVVWSVGGSNLVLSAVSGAVLLRETAFTDVEAGNPVTGEPLWGRSFAVSPYLPGVAAIAGNLVYVVHGDTFTMLNVSDGTTAATSPTFDGALAFVVPSNGRIFAASGQALYAVVPGS